MEIVEKYVINNNNKVINYCSFKTTTKGIKT